MTVTSPPRTIRLPKASVMVPRPREIDVPVRLRPPGPMFNSVWRTLLLPFRPMLLIDTFIELVVHSPPLLICQLPAEIVVAPVIVMVPPLPPPVRAAEPDWL